MLYSPKTVSARDDGVLCGAPSGSAQFQILYRKVYIDRGTTRTVPLNLAQLDDLTCAVLRGENAMWPSARGDDFEAMFIRRAEYHGVSALLQERMPQLSAWPSSVREAVRRYALAQALWELRHQQVLASW